MSITLFKQKYCLDVVKPLCFEFAEKIDKKLNWDYYSQTVGALIDAGVTEVLVFEDGNFPIGMLIYTYFPDLITGEMHATELAWYCKPNKVGAGVKLLDAMIANARQKECKQVNIVHMIDDDKVGGFLQKKGFNLYEKTYSLMVNN